MRNGLLISVAAAALLAGSTFASAQTTQQGLDAPAARTPSAAPPEKIDQGSPTNRARETTGQGMQKDAPAAAQKKQSTDTPASNRDAQSPRRPSDNQAQDRNERSRTGQGKDAQPSAQTQKDQPSGDSQRQRSGQKDDGKQQTGQKDGGGAGASASLSTEQRTRIRETVIKQGNAPRMSRANINFNISVGTAVPRTVRLVTLPGPVIEVYPAWRGYLYFIVGDEIVVVEPGSLRIVAVIAA